jgi:hypothetical protein
MKGVVERAASILLNNLAEVEFARIKRAKRLMTLQDSLSGQLIHHRAEAQRIEKEIARLERKIQMLLRFERQEKRKSKPGQLTQAILEALGRGGPMGLTEITKTILQRGYRTRSTFTNFRTTVAHALRQLRSELVRTEDGYTIKSIPRSTPKRGRKKSSVSAKKKRADHQGDAAPVEPPGK